MRIPEYRGFVKDLTIRPQWITGSHYYENRNPNAPKHFIRKFGEEQPYKIMPETLQQFTGCRDSRGKKVFEGDILHVQGEEGEFVVVWDADKAGFDITPPFPEQSMGESSCVSFFEWAEGCEVWYDVVGNSVQIEEEVFPSETPRRVK